MPPTSKDPSTRVRRNKTSTRAVLTPVTNAKIPPLPVHIKDWYPVVRDWWKRCWSSPMVPEWTESDIDALYLAARLQQQFWDPETPASTRTSTGGEIRQVLTQCGLTPMSRRSLQWEIDRGESAAQKTAQRRGTPPKKAAPKKADPRTTRRLSVVPSAAS
jgi:hypothetical protein